MPWPLHWLKTTKGDTDNAMKNKTLHHSMPLILLALFSLSGCAKDRSLAPPPDSEQVTVTVKVPKELVTEELKIIYRSSICTRTVYNVHDEPVELDGTNGTHTQLQQQGDSDLYQAKVAVDGGGECQWRLSNLTFGVAYADPTIFGENVTFGAGGGVVVIFDQNNSWLGGATFKVDGDLTIKKDYYPWLSEHFLGGYRKEISLAGQGDIYLMYKALQARSVYFEPVLHSDFILHSVGPKVKKEGNYISYTYPDGSVYADGRWHPDFRRLEEIRLNAEAKK
jgi:hypothetical protein